MMEVDLEHVLNMACKCFETQLEGAIRVWIDKPVEMH